VRDLLLHDDLVESTSMDESEVHLQTDPRLLQVVVEGHVVDVTERVQVTEPTLDGYSTHSGEMLGH
jgi:hypothetical protein